MPKNTYCEKEFLTKSPEPSTSTVVSFYGDIKWDKDTEGGNVGFLEISSCHERARLHRTYDMSEEEWLCQVKRLRDHINEYVKFLQLQIDSDNGQDRR
jgi:hypothetical protein